MSHKLEFYTKVENHGDWIYVRGYRDGIQFKKKIRHKPILFIPTSKEDARYKSIHGRTLESIEYDSIYTAKQKLKEFSKVHNFQGYGMEKPVVNFMHEEYPKDIEYDEKFIRIGSIDIETDSEGGFPIIELANKAITAISLVVKDRTIVWGMKDFVPPNSTVSYRKFNDETAMLRDFIHIWEKLALDIITGWNSTSFDMPYIVRRIRVVLGEDWVKRLSPWGIIKPRSIKSYRGSEIEIFDIFGINDIDYLLAFKKFRPPHINPDDNKLDTVAKLVLGEKKLDYSAYGSLNKLYKENPQLFFEYNVKDANLVNRIEEKLNILRLIMNMAYSAKVNMHEVFMQTRVWDSIIYGYLKDKNIIVPIVTREDEFDGKYEGAYVKFPTPNMYKWVVSFDLTSLYPSLILHYNIGPDTFIEKVNLIKESLLEHEPHGYEEYLKKNNYSMAANGAIYSRNKNSFMTDIVQLFFDKRQYYKKLKLETGKAKAAEKDPAKKKILEDKERIYDIYQQNFKININALYGALGTTGFRFNDITNAEAITISGQLTIKRAERWLNGYLNKVMGTNDVDYVIGADTDSLYVNFGPIIEKFKVPDDKAVDFLDKFAAQKVQPELNACFKELSEYMNSHQQKLHMKREKISDKLVFIAKKRYFQNVHDNEGVRYEKPKIEITGLEAVRTVVPEFCRNKLKEAYSIVLNGTEENMQKFIDETRKEYFQLPFPDVASPKGCKNLLKYSDKTMIYKRNNSAVPFHVRATLLYNHYLKHFGVDDQYESILEGEKIRYCYLKMPNPIQENVIAAPRILPPEFGLDEYIDYETQFEKTFLDPIRAILEVIGWNEEKTSTIEDIFV